MFLFILLDSVDSIMESVIDLYLETLIFGLWKSRPYKGEPGNEGASPQATGSSVAQGAGTQQIYALSVQNLSVSINDLNPRKGLASLNR